MSRRFALDGWGRLQLLRHELEGVGLEGLPVDHEDDLDGLGLADGRERREVYRIVVLPFQSSP